MAVLPFDVLRSLSLCIARRTGSNNARVCLAFCLFSRGAEERGEAASFFGCFDVVLVCRYCASPAERGETRALAVAFFPSRFSLFCRCCASPVRRGESTTLVTAFFYLLVLFCRRCASPDRAW